MLPPFTRRMEDHSSEEGFSFSFFCDLCGKEWRSVPARFSSCRQDPSLEKKVTQLIWQSQHAAAYERANQEAMLWHNRCHACGRWVCQDCYCIREEAVGDMCKACLWEKGR